MTGGSTATTLGQNGRTNDGLSSALPGSLVYQRIETGASTDRERNAYDGRREAGAAGSEIEAVDHAVHRPVVRYTPESLRTERPLVPQQLVDLLGRDVD